MDDAAMAYLAKKGYDPSFGARPLKRVIQREIENPLSLALLKGAFVKGDTIRFTLDDAGQGLVFGH
jgi:ATP-dependent Clp protease ATP-binding subunit ClpB